MTFVAAHQFSARGASVSFTVPSSAGELLLGFVTSPGPLVVASGAADMSRLVLPSGWVTRGLWSSVATGDPQKIEGSVMVVSALVSGAASGVVSWTGTVPAGLRLNVLRFSGMKGVRGVVAAQLNSQLMTFPGVNAPGSAAGHAVRVAVGPLSPWPAEYTAADLVPAGHVQRVSVQSSASAPWASGWTAPSPALVVVSEQSLTGASPATVSTSYRGAGWGVTIYLASTIGPAAPVVTAPSESTMDLAAGFALSWTPSEVQTGVRIRRQTGATVQYLSALTGGSWGASPVTITTAATSATISAGQFSNGGTVYDLGVATVGDASAPDLGDEAVASVTGWTAPTMTDVTSNNIVAGVFTSRVPWIVASGAAGSGASLTRFEVEVVDAASGAVLAAPPPFWVEWFEVPVASALPNGASVKLRARAIQNGEQPSAWIERGPYPVTVPTPPAPTLTVQPRTHPVSGLPGRRVVVTGIVTDGAGTVNLSRDGEGLGSYAASGTAGSPGSITIDDYSLPADKSVTYSATVTDAATPANTGPAGTATTVFSLDLEQVQWLHDPLDPAGAVGVHLRAVGDAVHGTRTTAFQTLGSGSWLVRSLGRVDAAGSFELETLDGPSAEAALALLTSGRRLSLRVPRERDGLGGLSPRAPILFRVVSGVSVSYVVQGDVSWRRITFDWVAQ